MSTENSTDSTKNPYRVLALKYRPQSFEELIGQDALVRTLKNAIETGRIAHAFMLTGVRGVGKTTTARIIAKALNYRGPDGKSGPTTGPTEDCDLCRAISEDRHPDVIEMDAASRTGIDDIREILDGVRYAPTEARYKVYIIDEVHMLSKQAFNALLKTLEEPPEHVKFIFATTEIRKVPITVLSRCQRFDLRRVSQAELQGHFKNICAKEDVGAEDEALAMIGRAADGSVRDGLSILDQAIAMSSAGVTEEGVRNMLGLSDRAMVLDLLDHVLGGDMPKALEVMDHLYAVGADPVLLMQDLLEIVHALTKFRAVPDTAMIKQAMSSDQIKRAQEITERLSMPILNKAWQILLKGLEEVHMASNAQNAAEMVIIRLGYAAGLPDPQDLIKKLQDMGANGAPLGGGNGASAAPMGGAGHGDNGHAGSGHDGPQAGYAGDDGAPVGANSGSSSGRAGDAPRSMYGAGVQAGGGAYGGLRSISGGGAAAVKITMAEPEVEAAVFEDADDLAASLKRRQVDTIDELVSFLEDADEIALAGHVYQAIHLVRLEHKKDVIRVEVRPEETAPSTLTQDLGKAMSKHSGKRWVFSISNAQGNLTMAEVSHQVHERILAEVHEDPLVSEALALFPGAEIAAIEG